MPDIAKKPDYTLEDIMAHLAQMDLTRAPKMLKLDSKDTSVGSLDEYMQRLWILRCQMRETASDIVSRMCDHVTAHVSEHRQHDESVAVYREQAGDHANKAGEPKWDNELWRAFQEKLDTLFDTFRQPAVTATLIEDIFIGLLFTHFPELSGKGAWGIRDGYEVVWREKNDRGDNDRLLQPLLDDIRAFANSHHTVIEIVIAGIDRQKAETTTSGGGVGDGGSK